MVMFGNYAVSQSYLNTVTPHSGKTEDPSNFQISEGPASKCTNTGSAKTSASPDEQSEGTEAESRPTFTHPLASEEDLMARNVAVDAHLAPVDSGVIGPSRKSDQASSADAEEPRGCSSGIVPVKSAGCAPRSSQMSSQDSTLGSRPEQTQLSQSQSSSSLEATAMHSRSQTGSNTDVTLTESAESAATASLISRSSGKYDFVMWYHEDDETVADVIYNFLENDLNLKGFRYCRDKTLGQYKLTEITETIRVCHKILLFITPRSKNCGMFEKQTHYSLTNSIESNRNNVIPIYWELHRSEGPSVVRSIFSIEYQHCNEKFKKQIAKIFKKLYTSSADSCYSNQSLTSSVSKNLKQSISAPSAPEKKSLLSRIFSKK